MSFILTINSSLSFFTGVSLFEWDSGSLSQLLFTSESESGTTGWERSSSVGHYGQGLLTKPLLLFSEGDVCVEFGVLYALFGLKIYALLCMGIPTICNATKVDNKSTECQIK